MTSSTSHQWNLDSDLSLTEVGTGLVTNLVEIISITKMKTRIIILALRARYNLLIVTQKSLGPQKSQIPQN